MPYTSKITHTLLQEEPTAVEPPERSDEHGGSAPPSTPAAVRTAAGPGTPGRPDRPPQPTRVFVVMMACLITLVGLGVSYTVSADVRAAFPPALWGLPIGVPWLGALGGTLASLSAVGQHGDHWSPNAERLHLARPLVAAVTGVLAAIMLRLLADLGAGGSGAKLDAVTYDVIAFVAGYRDETFRLMVSRATDALLVPGQKEPAQAHHAQPHQ